jgi:hypothetical protein
MILIKRRIDGSVMPFCTLLSIITLPLADSSACTSWTAHLPVLNGGVGRECILEDFDRLLFVFPIYAVMEKAFCY